MLNEEVDYGVIKVTKDKDVSKVILGWVEGLVLVTVMMIVIVKVVGEVMVIIDIVDNQYTARRVHGGLLFIQRPKLMKNFHLPVDKNFPSTFCK